MENVYENELDENEQPPRRCKSAMAAGMPASAGTPATAEIQLVRSNSTHSVRLHIPSSTASSPALPRVLLPPTPPSPTSVSLSAVSDAPVEHNQRQQDNQQDLQPSLKLGNSSNSTKKARVDFVRFDSTEIHYTDHDEVRTKISDEIKR